MRGIVRSSVTAVIAAFVVGLLCSLQSVGFGFRSPGVFSPGVFSPGVRLMSGTVLAMGGASNPHGESMETELDGYFSGSPGTQYAGYDFRAVEWSAQVVAYGFGTLFYDQSQAEGLAAIDAAIYAAIEAGDPAPPVVVVGYSASAGAVTKELRVLQSRRAAGLAAPDPADLSFILFGNPNRPNGGILNRLAGLYIPPPLGVTFDGPTPATDYQTLDVSWEYDPVSDFPNQPFNILADLNAFVAFATRHSFYYDVDLTDTDSYVADVTVGNTRYVTLRREHLPLLEPLYKFLPVLAPVFDAVEPVLKYMVDLAYDRTVGPAVSTPLVWGPPRRDPAAVIDGFVSALHGSRSPVPPPVDRAIAPEPPKVLRGADSSATSPARVQRSQAPKASGHGRGHAAARDGNARTGRRAA